MRGPITFSALIFASMATLTAYSCQEKDAEKPRAETPGASVEVHGRELGADEPGEIPAGEGGMTAIHLSSCTSEYGRRHCRVVTEVKAVKGP